MAKSKPEWREIIVGVGNNIYSKIEWCASCGCLKITVNGKKTRYRVPRREAERRKAARGDIHDGPVSPVYSDNRNNEQQREFGGAG